jgi:thiamine biosynthesis lipoprotein
VANDQPSSRRDFLRGQSAVRAIASAVDRLAEATLGAPPELRSIGPPTAQSRCSASRRIMACEFVVETPAALGPVGAEAAIAALDRIEGIEDRISIFREQSELTFLNRHAADEPVQVSEVLFDLIRRAVELSAETNGAFDVTGTPLSRAWGFLTRQGRLPSAEEIAAAMGAVGVDLIQLDQSSRQIRFAQPGVEINFHAMGKGYALDCAAETMADLGVGDFLAHGGRSSVLARGDGGVGGWAIEVPDPQNAGAVLGRIVLRNECLGTTGSGVQFFEADGRRYGHVLDPRTGWPAEGVLTATVVAASAADADALSTALYVLGPGGAAEFCARRPDVGAVVVCPSESAQGGADCHVFNLGPDRWHPGE